jgi:flavin-dependent dehydrogenase
MIRPSNAERSYDVIVIGGGPAGSTAATLLAQHGRRVALLERTSFPRFHIGESLIPRTYWTLDRLGLVERMRRSHFPRKYSVQFVTERGQYGQPFYFFETNPHESAVTWQVFRGEFDRMLLDNAREHGVEVCENTRVLDVLFEGQQAVGVQAQQGDEESAAWRARVVVDASGQSSLLANRFGLREMDPVLRKGTVWTYFEGAERDPGIDEGATLVLRTEGKRGWFWYIPLPYNQVSVGAVGSSAEVLPRGCSLEEAYEAQLARCPAVRERVEKGRRVSEFYATRDFSYACRRGAGDGWVLVGDALGFLDPIYSTGVLLALASGQMAADTIHSALAVGNTSEARLGAWVPGFLRGMDMFRKLVYAYYTPSFSFGSFLREHPKCRAKIIDVLVGDVFKKGVDELYRTMGDVRPAAVG